MSPVILEINRAKWPFRMADPAAGRLEIPFAPGIELLLEKVVWRLDQGFQLLLAKRRV